MNNFSNPYEEPDLKKVLSRVYKVDEFEWSPDDTEGQSINVVSFPKALFDIPNISAKLEQFEWLRADVEVEVKINATDFHIGALMLSTMPHMSTVGDPRMNTHEQRCQAQNVVVVPASSVNSVKLQIRRCGPRMFDQAHDEGIGEIGNLYIDVFHPLSVSSGVAAPVKISVFANFLDPQLAGYGVTPLSPEEIKARMKRVRSPRQRAEKHSKTTPHEEAVAKSSKGLVSGVAESMGGVGPLLAMTPFAEFAPIAMMAGMAAPFLKSLGLDKPVDLRATQPFRQDNYRDLLHGHGLFDGTRVALHPEASLADVNLSQLKRHSIQEIISRPQCVKKGVLNTSVVTGEAFEHFPVTNGLSAHSQALDWSLYYPSHMAYISQMFKRWAGGIKFHIKFVTSKFTTTRVRFLHFPNAELPPNIEDYAGDTPSAVVDVRGSTEFSFVLPYLSPYPYLPTVGFYAPGDNVTLMGLSQVPWLAFSLVSPVCVPDTEADSKIYYSIWVSAAEDFTLGTFDEWNLKKSSWEPSPFSQLRKALAREEAPRIPTSSAEKHSLELEFGKPFKPLVPAMARKEAAFVLSEQYTSIEDLTHRFERLQTPIDGIVHIGITPAFVFSGPEAPVLARLAALFQFYRGSQRLKIVRPTNLDLVQSAQLVEYTKYTTYTGKPTRTMYQADTPTLDIEIPWNEDSYLRTIYPDFPDDMFDSVWDNTTVSCLTGGGPEATDYFRATGEDFVFGSLTPCPAIDATEYPPSTTAARKAAGRVPTAPPSTPRK